MAKHDTDPVLRQLVHAINDSVQAAVPVTMSVFRVTGSSRSSDVSFCTPAALIFLLTSPGGIRT
jgi:hypothetical protein